MYSWSSCFNVLYLLWTAPEALALDSFMQFNTFVFVIIGFSCVLGNRALHTPPLLSSPLLSLFACTILSCALACAVRRIRHCLFARRSVSDCEGICELL
jgi:hypothetical protein